MIDPHQPRTESRLRRPWLFIDDSVREYALNCLGFCPSVHMPMSPNDLATLLLYFGFFKPPEWSAALNFIRARVFFDN